MGDYFCSDCKCFTEVVSDQSAGDTICSECGLVLESYSIDETSEWRNFADDSSGSDPNRVGNPVNPLLTGLSTVISRQDGGLGVNGHVPNRALVGRGESDTDKNVLVGFKTIAAMADRLSLVSTIKDRANEIFKRLDDQKCIKGRNVNALIAACIYIACRKEGKARTVKEICCVAHGASKKDVGRAKEFIVRQLKVEMGESMEMGTIHAGDYLRRFCSNLRMSNMEIKAVQETVQSSQECCDIRRSPLSVAAAIIYMILQLSDTKKTLRDIALSTTVADVTIRNAYKDIYPHASRIVPKWYATDIDLKKLAAVRN